MSEKDQVDIGLSSAHRLLHPMHTALVSCIGNDGRPNIITLAWVMPTSIRPPLIAMSIAPKRHSYHLIEETEEFVVNIPTMRILRETLFCGRKSGRSHDKIKELDLTILPARKVKSPIIGECVAHLECKLRSNFVTGDHTSFIGEIIEAYADKGVFKEKYDLERASMIFHLGDNDFATLKPKIHTPKI